MSLALYMDENVPGQVVDGLRRRGVDVVTAVEDGLSSVPDPDVLDRAATMGRILYSEDDDLIAEAYRRVVAGRSFPGVIFVHPLQLTIGQRVRDLEWVAKSGTAEEFADRVQYLPIRRPPRP